METPPPTTTTTTTTTPRHHQNHPLPPITRSESNPYPTTFVQADTFSFKQVVQMLTGSSEASAKSAAVDPPAPSKHHPIPPIKSAPKSKLYERRNSLKNLPLSPLFSPGNNPSSEILSPSVVLDFPALALSPVTPLIPDPFNRSPVTRAVVNTAAEEKAIAEKGFYLHPSPTTTPRESEPKLLPLFPVTSPGVSGSDNSSS